MILPPPVSFAIAYQAFEDRILVLAVAHPGRRPLYRESRSDAEVPDDPGRRLMGRAFTWTLAFSTPATVEARP